MRSCRRSRSTKRVQTLAPGYTGGMDAEGVASEMVVDGDGFTHYKTVAKM